MPRSILALIAFVLLQPQALPLSRQEAVSRRGQAEIYIMRPDGSKQTRVTQSSRFDQRPAWSPDSRRLAFGAGSSGQLTVMVMGLDDSDARAVSPPGTRQVRPDWSPDGGRLVVQQIDGQSR
jgi:Tol biopolymer transport system component